MRESCEGGGQLAGLVEVQGQQGGGVGHVASEPTVCVCTCVCACVCMCV